MEYWRPAALFALVILMACGSSTGPRESIYGTYTLRTMGGNSLPYVTMQTATDTFTYTDGTFTLGEGGTFSEMIHRRDSRSGVVTIQNIGGSGTFVRSGTSITTTDPASGSQTGTIANDTVTFSTPGFSIVFVK